MAIAITMTANEYTVSKYAYLIKYPITLSHYPENQRPRKQRLGWIFT